MPTIIIDGIKYKAEFVTKVVITPESKHEKQILSKLKNLTIDVPIHFSGVVFFNRFMEEEGKVELIIHPR